MELGVKQQRLHGHDRGHVHREILDHHDRDHDHDHDHHLVGLRDIRGHP
jgi:hypothetical protein